MTLGGNVNAYYRLHAGIYDITRWAFLFGRRHLMRRLKGGGNPRTILEVGCGTGSNVILLAQQFPNAEVTGIDLSEDMLNVARRKCSQLGDRVRLVQEPYAGSKRGGYDLIVFSYALTMFNPGWEAALDHAIGDLSKDGLIAVVDFHGTEFDWFRQWMAMNHVRMEKHLLPRLKSMFDPVDARVHAAYLGLWKYVSFIGRPR